MLETETLLEFAEELLHTHTKGYFSDLQRIVLLTALQGSRKTYDEIAEECGYSAKYIKQDVAPKLWHILSEILGEKLTKSNIRAVLEKQMRQQGSPAPASNQPTATELSPSVPVTDTIFSPTEPSVYPKGNVLLVDDQPHNLHLLSDLLEEQGYEVRQALDGEIALQAATLSPPDLILLDINMPQMDGYTVCQRLKANVQTRHIPVIFVSALDEAWDKVKAFSVGGIDYIAKPFKVVEVLARVENQLKIHHLQKRILAQNAQLQQAIQELQRLAALDELTQVANRRRFEDYITSEWQQSLVIKQPLSLIFCRLDRFKAYNTTHGHATSDRCLFQLAQTLKRAVTQPEALICRYEGATFAIILARTETTACQQIAATILQQVQTLRPSETQLPTITLSVGTVSTLPTPEQTLDAFIQQGDNALQQAESQGGNQVVNSV